MLPNPYLCRIIQATFNGADMPIPQRILTGEIRDVYSGDDLVVWIDLQCDDLFKKKRVRLHGVDTPDARGQGPETEAGQLRQFVRNTLKGRTLNIVPVSQNGTSIVAIIEVEIDGKPLNLNEVLIARGYKFNR